MQNLMNYLIARLNRDEEGATAVEYGLLVGLISIAIVGTLLLLGPVLDGLFQQVLNALPGAPAGP